MLFILFFCGVSFSSLAFSFNLDSIASMGKVPRFGVDVYRWGDHFFNGYDTTYVVGTGYKFNAKIRANSWIDHYRFYLPDNIRMNMTSDPSTSAGLWLTYLAVSVGYDKNISRFFGSNNYKARQQFSFGFNCSLFTFNMRFIDNTGGVTIKRFGSPGHYFNPDIEFYGLHSKLFGFDTYYFFNHKRYSQAAAFNFSRIQTRSQGSWFAGLSFYNQQFDFDFNALPAYIVSVLPDTWIGHKYVAKTKNFAIKFGYGYNWVANRHWTFAISESPTLGIKKGIINNPGKKSVKALMSNELKASIVYNNKEWFAGAIGVMDAAIVYDNGSSFQNSVLEGFICVGYRFNIW